MGITGIGDGTHQRLGQAKVGKRNIGSNQDNSSDGPSLKLSDSNRG